MHLLLKPFSLYLLLGAGTVLWVAEIANWFLPPGIVRPISFPETMLVTFYFVILSTLLLVVVRRFERIREALEKNRESFRLLYEEAPLAYQALDENDRIVEVNQAWLDMLGYRREEVVGRAFGDFVGDGIRFRESFDDFKARGTASNRELSLRHKDGTPVAVSIDGRIAACADGSSRRLHCIFSNITERTRAAQVLAESEQRYRVLAEASPDMIFLVDPDGRLRYVNSYGAQLFKREISDVLGKHQEELFPSDIARYNRERFAAVVATGKMTRPAEPVYFPQVDLWLDVRLAPVKNGGGDVVAVLGIGRDVTLIRKAAQERECLQLQLIQSEKMAGIGTLAGGISHEFNNLLQVIRGNAEVGLEERTPDGMLQSLKTILDVSERATRIVSSLLSFSRNNPGRMERLRVGDVVESVLSFTEMQLNKQGIVVCKSYADNPWVEANRTELQQVLLNIIINARDAMLGGGKLTIGVRQNKDAVDIEFHDTGTGIKKEFINRIFEPFFTTKGAIGKSPIPGTGLGLYVCYGIIQRHRGMIDVQSDGQSYTRFIVRIPMSA